VAKRVVHEEHENHERWLVSYADFMTLLFAFFVVMYAVSSVDTKRVTAAQKSVRWAMHFEGKGGTNSLPLYSTAPAGGQGMLDSALAGPMVRQRIRKAEDTRKQLEKKLAPMLMGQKNRGGKVVVEVDGRTLRVRLSAGQFFDAGSAVLRPDALPVLDIIMEEVTPLQQALRVEGHTDDRLVGGRFKSNWELSSSRAAAVVDYIERAHGYPSSMLSLVGYGASRPLKSNNSSDGREANRRIDLSVEFEAAGNLNSL
jgi:chemotaxis protein MotB